MEQTSLVLEKKIQQVEFENAVKDYRSLLAGGGSREKERNLGRMFHRLLVEPVMPFLQDKKRLCIIPDGILGYLPFETFITEEGSYFAENYRIKYNQSITIQKLLKARMHDPKRKPLLAFGGAVYNEGSADSRGVEITAAYQAPNNRQLNWIEKETDRLIRDQASLKNNYAQLGFENWSPLPGSLDEVKQISQGMSGCELLVGENVSENLLKQYSQDGRLAEYKVIHFATHGVVVPDLPELSALVLSQFEDEINGEDGYLRMGEIVRLKLAADFVNLSACETGIGRIYRGEGVVGLTQAFLIAGANGLSVSLWPIGDDSTATFMAELYQRVYYRGMTFEEGITDVKRAFINGDFGEQWEKPLYWAPFVYYGQ